MKVRKAVIPAAGFGTRMLPASKSIPKEMLPIFDKPTIQYIVEEVAHAGIEDVLLIISKDKGAIADHFDSSAEVEEVMKTKNPEMYEILKNISNLCNVHFVRQKTKNGLGDAITYAETFVGDEPFAVLLGDDVVYHDTPCIGQLMKVYDEYECSIVGVQEVPKEDVDKYGIVDGKKIGERLYEVNSLVEKPKPEEATTNVAILGRYIITPEIFKILKGTRKGFGGEVQLTDALNTLSKSQKIMAYDFEGRRYDVGSKKGLFEANVEYALREEKYAEELKEFLKELHDKNYNV